MTKPADGIKFTEWKAHDGGAMPAECEGRRGQVQLAFETREETAKSSILEDDLTWRVWRWVWGREDEEFDVASYRLVIEDDAGTDASGQAWGEDE